MPPTYFPSLLPPSPRESQVSLSLPKYLVHPSFDGGAMSIILLIAALVTSATVVAFVIIAKGTPEPTVASMLRGGDVREGGNR